MAVRSHKRMSRLRVGRLRGGRFTTRNDQVAVEEPMEIRVEVPGAEGVSEHPVSVTMRTPGDDFELAAGFLYTEGIITDPSSIKDVRYCQSVDPQEYNVVNVLLRRADAFDAASLTRNFYVTSSCGVCGKASLEAVEVMGCAAVPDGTFSVDAAVVQQLPERLKASQGVFTKTGGIHAAALFDESGELHVLREDVGRHNAVDKVVGDRVLKGKLPASDLGLLVSGRTSFEILQKAAMAGIPLVVAVGAPSSLAVRFAKAFNLTLLGFTKETGFNVYAGAERVGGLDVSTP